MPCLAPLTLLRDNPGPILTAKYHTMGCNMRDGIVDTKWRTSRDHLEAACGRLTEFNYIWIALATSTIVEEKSSWRSSG